MAAKSGPLDAGTDSEGPSVVVDAASLVRLRIVAGVVCGRSAGVASVACVTSVASLDSGESGEACAVARAKHVMIIKLNKLFDLILVGC